MASPHTPAASVHATARGPAYQAYQILHVGFTAAPSFEREGAITPAPPL